MPNGSFTVTHQSSSTPAFFRSSAFVTYPGTCLAEQVGVKAPGRPKIATVLPAVSFAMSNVFGPIEQPLPSTSMNSCSEPAGSWSPTLIMCVSLWLPSDRRGLLHEARHDPRLGLRD